MQTSTPRALSQSALDQFHRDGYVVVPQLLAPGEVDEIRDTFMSANADGPIKGLSEIGHHQTAPGGYEPSDPLAFYPRMMNPHQHPDLAVGRLSWRMMLDPRLGAVAWDLFGEEPIAGQSMFYFKPPGARGQDLHQDNFYLRVSPGTCIAAWLAVDDSDLGNGGLVVVPGTGGFDIACPEKADPKVSFALERVPPPPGKEPHIVPMRAGDVMFWSGGLIHGSYPNASLDRFRRALIFHYMPMSCSEINEIYKPLVRFDGSVVVKAPASGGGPCGNLEAPASRH
jgi:phytanoyl-CoA hydroxylase